MRELIIVWTIENIGSSWHKTGSCINSPEFFASSMLNTTWTLKLYPRGTSDSDYFSLKLCREKGQGPENLAVKFEISCMSADASAILSSLVRETSKSFDKYGYSEYLHPCFLQRCEVFGPRKALYLPKDILILRCRIWKDEEECDEFEQVCGRTELTVEKMIRVGDFYPEKSVEETFQIESQGKALLSITISCFDDNIQVRIDPIRKKMEFFSCEIKFLDNLTKRTLCEHARNFFYDLSEMVWRLPFTDILPPTENINSGGRCYKFVIALVYPTGKVNNTIDSNCPVIISEFLSNYSNCHFSSFSLDLKFFYEKKVLCDVKLKTENESFDAHKTVLCARSPVFSAMLTSGMKENTIACIEITDILPDTLEIFLHFLYSDRIGYLEWDELIKLYYAADKYGVELLKLLCCSHLLKKIAVENVCELLMLADKHHDRKLERKILDLISKNEEIVFRSSSWKNFVCEEKNYKKAFKIMGWKYVEKDELSPDRTYDDWISSHPTIQDDFGILYQSGIACDVLIKSAGATFPAHKTVLCASSTKFMEESTKDFGDKSTEAFEMGDWDDDTVSRMLLFLYNNSFKGIQWDTAIKLYQLAIEYDIERLQIQCSSFLLENLNVCNASSVLLLADKNQDTELKPIVESYISLHDEEIFGSDEWTDFCETNYRLAIETMQLKYRKK